MQMNIVSRLLKSGTIPNRISDATFERLRRTRLKNNREKKEIEVDGNDDFN
jgi:hypothetical protein